MCTCKSNHNTQRLVRQPVVERTLVSSSRISKAPHVFVVQPNGDERALTSKTEAPLYEASNTNI